MLFSTAHEKDVTKIAFSNSIHLHKLSNNIIYNSHIKPRKNKKKVCLALWIVRLRPRNMSHTQTHTQPHIPTKTFCFVQKEKSGFFGVKMDQITQVMCKRHWCEIQSEKNFGGLKRWLWYELRKNTCQSFLEEKPWKKFNNSLMGSSWEKERRNKNNRDGMVNIDRTI